MEQRYWVSFTARLMSPDETAATDVAWRSWVASVLACLKSDDRASEAALMHSAEDGRLIISSVVRANAKDEALTLAQRAFSDALGGVNLPPGHHDGWRSQELLDNASANVVPLAA